nr:hypothetical protein [Tanacetum cinerariifolium]
PDDHDHHDQFDQGKPGAVAPVRTLPTAMQIRACVWTRTPCAEIHQGNSISRSKYGDTTQVRSRYVVDVRGYSPDQWHGADCWPFPAVTALAHWSQDFYPQLAERLLKVTGIDPEVHQTGLYWLDLDDEKEALEWAQRLNRPLSS